MNRTEISNAKRLVWRTGGRASLGVLLLVLALGSGFGAWLLLHRTGEPIPAAAAQNAAEPQATSEPAALPAAETSDAPPPRETKHTVLTPRVIAVAPTPNAPAAPSRPEPSPVTRQLVTTLSQLEIGHGPIAPEQAAAWKQTLQQLATQKEAAVPAIREFLEKNVDISFDAEADRKAMGVPSLRLALLETMEQIGGPEALDLSLQTLQTTADPLELANLTKYLEQTDPGKYRDTELSAAREALSLAASGKWDGRDVSPIMEILTKYGGASAVADLQRLGNTFFDYSPIMLGSLPEGAGVQALMQWVTNPDAPAMSGNDLYLRMLAQSASQYPEAFDTLLQQAAANRISSAAWAGIAAALGGSTLELANPSFDSLSPLASRSDARRYHIAAGNQNFLDLPPSDDMTALQAGDRMRMVDRLLSSTSNPAAIQALQSARAALAGRIK